MHRSRRVLLIVLPTVLAAIGVVHSATTPEAQQWLNRMHEAYERGPFRVDYKAEMNTDRMGQQVRVALEGESTHKDPTHMHMELVVKMAISGVSLDMNVLQVADGELLWMEMNNPAGGDKQVLKISVDKAGQIATAGSGALGGGSVDPVGQIRDMTEKFEFQLVGVAEGRVTLKANLTEEARAELLSDAPPLAEAMEEITLVLDEQTGVPREMRIGGASPFLTVHLGSFEYLEQVEASLFQYTPPAGVQVMDLDQMVNAGQPQPQSSSE